MLAKGIELLPCLERLDLRRVAPPGVAHAGIDGVAGLRQRVGSERPEAAGRASDDDDLRHGVSPCPGQTNMPPETSILWALIQRLSSLSNAATAGPMSSGRP